MKNNIYNRIAPPANTAEMTGEAQKAIQSVSAIITFLATLSGDERKSLTGMDISNKAFTEDALNAARSNAAILPPYHSLARFEHQVAAFEAMDVLIQNAQDMLQQLCDTRLVMGAAAYQTSLSLYHYFDQARKDGVAGAESAYQLLADRFKGQGNFNQTGKDGQHGKEGA